MMVQRFGFHMMPTRLVLTFDRALDATAAQNLSNYRITTASGGRIKLKSAVYDDRTHTVTLATGEPDEPAPAVFDFH